MNVNQGATPEFLKHLSSRLAEERKKAEALALWDLIQEEADAIQDNRLGDILVGHASNSIKMALSVENVPSTGQLYYTLGLVVNGDPMEVTGSMPMDLPPSMAKDAVLQTLRDRMGKKLADYLFAGVHWSAFGPVPPKK